MTRAAVKDGEIRFESPLARLRFLKSAEGKEIRLEVMEQPTDEMRKYFEGCLVPAFFYLHPLSGWTSFTDAREVLKLEFAPGVRELTTEDGTAVKVAPSTMKLGKAKFTRFVESIVEWMLENGVPAEVLDSEEYTRWRDTNFTDEYYPPLRRLKEQYTKLNGD